MAKQTDVPEAPLFIRMARKRKAQCATILRGVAAEFPDPALHMEAGPSIEQMLERFQPHLQTWRNARRDFAAADLLERAWDEAQKKPEQMTKLMDSAHRIKQGELDAGVWVKKHAPEKMLQATAHALLKADPLADRLRPLLERKAKTVAVTRRQFLQWKAVVLGGASLNMMATQTGQSMAVDHRLPHLSEMSRTYLMNHHGGAFFVGGGLSHVIYSMWNKQHDPALSTEEFERIMQRLGGEYEHWEKEANLPKR